MSFQPAPTLANSFECTYVGICIFGVYEVRTSYIEFDTSYADIAVRFDEMRRVPLFGFDTTQKNGYDAFLNKGVIFTQNCHAFLQLGWRLGYGFDVLSQLQTQRTQAHGWMVIANGINSFQCPYSDDSGIDNIQRFFRQEPNTRYQKYSISDHLLKTSAPLYTNTLFKFTSTKCCNPNQ